jgi:integrase
MSGFRIDLIIGKEFNLINVPRGHMETLKKKKKFASYRTGEKALTLPEYKKVLAACDNLEDRLVIMIGVNLGLRREDLVRVRVENIDLENQVLTYLEMKKGNRIRKVPIGDTLTSEIKIYLKEKCPKDYLFPSKLKGLPHLSGKTAYNRLQMLCKKAGIETRPFHSLRGTAIKLHMNAGWTVDQCAALIGDTCATVQGHYSCPSSGELREVMKRNEGI